MGTCQQARGVNHLEKLNFSHFLEVTEITSIFLEIIEITTEKSLRNHKNHDRNQKSRTHFFPNDLPLEQASKLCKLLRGIYFPQQSLKGFSFFPLLFLSSLSCEIQIPSQQMHDFNVNSTKSDSGVTLLLEKMLCKAILMRGFCLKIQGIFIQALTEIYRTRCYVFILVSVTSEKRVKIYVKLNVRMTNYLLPEYLFIFLPARNKNTWRKWTEEQRKNINVQLIENKEKEIGR